MTVYYGKECWRSLYLTVDTGYGLAPALGVTYDMLALKMSRNGSDFEDKEVLEEHWRDLGEGFYTLLWTESDLSVLGQLTYALRIPSLNIAEAGVFDVDPAPFYLDVSAPTCVVTGNIVDIGGDPIFSNQLSFRPRNVPGVAGQSLLASGHIRTSTDAYGNFSVKLLRGAIVLVEIENAGIRHLITVPDTPTASLIDLLPPIPLPIP